MRDAFIAELHRIAGENDDVVLLSGDIGFKVFDDFVASYPGRYINMGIAEANMMGVAAGLALSGKRPVVYTIIPFLTMRAYEQIRVDVAMHSLPVTIVGVGGGLAYDILGPTHHAIEDVAILRALPGMTILVPADPSEARAATRVAYDANGPVYIRLGKNGEPPLSEGESTFRLGKATVLRPGNGVSIVGSGPILGNALEAARILELQGIDCRVVNLHTVKPLDREAIIAAARETAAIVVVEEHNVIGGTGSAVAEILAETGIGMPFRSLGIPDVFTFEVGSRDYLLKMHGLTAQDIAEAMKALLS